MLKKGIKIIDNEKQLVSIIKIIIREPKVKFIYNAILAFDKISQVFISSTYDQGIK